MDMLRFFVIFAFLAAAPAYGQEIVPEIQQPPQEAVPEIGPPELPDIDVAESLKKNKDLTVRSEADRARILEQLYKDLKAAEGAENAGLVAEEIWAVFLQSGSKSVDFLLLRGVAAQNRGDLKLARRMYDHVTRLQPGYSEGWSRSGRLAIEEDDLSRAVSDTTQSLIYEPRHFYALWTLGNILETLGRTDEAFEAYSEAAKLYPQHEEIKSRLDFLKEAVKGKAL